ncbi:MAG: DNA mismatch repair endonuclease MutL, partial [Chloroflexota bacterium]
GQGIPAWELALAFERHATSKISSADDLQAVATLGFRGEALPSIATVAQVLVTTRTAQADAGARLELHGGEVVQAGAAGCAPGTTLTVRNLFYNTPARFKFLKSPLAEGGQVTRVASQLALAYPGIAFSLRGDGRTIFQSSGNGNLRDVVARLYGAEVARAMLDVELCEGLQVRGLTSHPSLHRSNRNALSLFVNGRWVQSRPLLHAVEEAYSSLLMVGQHPLAVLQVNLDPSQVDVNVHPAKSEVKFAAERQVYARLRQAVTAALDWAARQSTPASPLPAPTAPGAGAEPSLFSGDVGWSAAPFPGTVPAVSWGQDAPSPQAWPLPSASGSEGGVLPMLRVLGQVAQSYIVAEGPGGLYLVDQHAAHERVRLDELERARAAAAGQLRDVQPLLQPLTLELAPALLAAAELARPELAKLGFELEPFGDRTYLLRSIPAIVPPAEARRTVNAILDDLLLDVPGETHQEHLLHSLACHSAVRAGQLLSHEEMRALLAALEACRQPRACAHGRPTMVHLSQAQLEREFGRR